MNVFCAQDIVSTTELIRILPFPLDSSSHINKVTSVLIISNMSFLVMMVDCKPHFWDTGACVACGQVCSQRTPPGLLAESASLAPFPVCGGECLGTRAAHSGHSDPSAPQRPGAGGAHLARRHPRSPRRQGRSIRSSTY